MGTRLGIDTGGTFTDLIGIDEATNRIIIAKTASTPRRPVDAVMSAIERSGLPVDTITSLSIGTTVATNALLTRNGANVLYLTTEGFEDIPYIQRMSRKHHFSLAWRKPNPLVERRNCFGIRERLDFHGRIVVPLDAASLEEVAARIAERESEYPTGSLAIAVCFLFSYVNPDHELAVRDFLAERFPRIPVSLSHQIAPIWREYERGSTVIADGYIKPIMQDYVTSTADAFAAGGISTPWTLMKSNGGRTTTTSAEAEPIKLLLSGLAGGIIAGHYFGRLAELENIVTLDMGGTSCDVGLIRDGKIGHSTNFEIEFGLPIVTSTIDLTTIGAGGGSIAWIDKGGLLRVGPGSAGADPGPICYGVGGSEVTVTDANLVLGRLNPDYFLGGDIGLHLDEAAAALDELGARLKIDRLAAARAVVDIANENMANAIRVLSIDRGLDPREFALVAFGGAGPLHACDIAAKMGMKRVIVPIYPGLTSAFGALIAEPKVSSVWSKHFRSDSLDELEVNDQMKAMTEDVIAELRSEGIAGEPRVSRTISMRYWGQNYEHDVTMPDGEITRDLLEETLSAFHRVHEEFYGYSIAGQVIELIRFNVEATGGEPPKIDLAIAPAGDWDATAVGSRPVVLDARHAVDCPIVRRESLPAGFTATGPMIVEEQVSTTLLHPGQRLEVLPSGVISILLQ